MNEVEKTSLLYLTYLPAFVELAFEVLQPQEKYHANWHIDVCCLHLDRLVKGHVSRLVLNLPPRNLKSTIASAAFPVWAMLRDPTLRVAILGGTQDLTSELQKNVLSILNSEFIAGFFPSMKFTRDGNELNFAEGGSILFVPYGQPLIGRGFHIIVVDDPNPPSRTKKKRDRDELNSFLTTDVLPRLSLDGRVVIVQQRTHARDLTGYATGVSDQWCVVAIAAVATCEETWPTGLDTYVRKKGEAICPSRQSVAQWRAMLGPIPATDFMAQIQQRPYPEDTPSESQGRMVFARPRPGWDPTSGFAATALMKVQEIDLVAQAVFGEELPFLLYDPSQASMETWERGAVAQQASLVLYSKGLISPMEHLANVTAAAPGDVHFDVKLMEKFKADIVWSPLPTQSLALKA